MQTIPLNHQPRYLPAALLPAYVLVYWLSDVFRLPETGSTPWNPEAGLALSAFVLFGPRWLPLMALTHFLCLAVWAPFATLPWTAVLATAHMSAMAGLAIRGRAHFLGLVDTGSGNGTRFVAAALATTIASALAQMLVSVFATDWSLQKTLAFGMTVWVGNMVGIVTVAPVALEYPQFNLVRDFLRSVRWGGVLLLGLLIATCGLVFGLPGLNQFKFFYLAFLPMIAIALRDGMAGAVVGSLTASIAMIIILGMRDFNSASVSELQFLMITLSVTSLLLGATIDERKRLHAESMAYLSRLRESEDALMRASRISLASEMVAAVSHELAQPLSAARNHTRALRRRLALPRRNRDQDVADLDAAVMQIDAAAATIRNMRDFLKRGEAEKGRLDLRALALNSADLLRQEFRRANITLNLHGFDGLPAVHGNRTQILQVLLNLLRNARDAIADSGATAGVVTIKARAGSHPGYVVVCVEDSGPGVAADVLRNIFMPLRSAKREGLGLGLSLCKSIVTAHGGELWYDQQVKAGARFCFSLPIAETGGPE